MLTPPATAKANFDAWNPGIESRIPCELRPLATIFRPENVFTSLERADEMCDFTGLPIADLVAFKPERLALHETLVRVTADVSVPDGTKIEDLGINFREIVSVVLDRYVLPRMGVITETYDALRKELSALIASELAPLFPQSAIASARAQSEQRIGLFARLMGRATTQPTTEEPNQRERQFVTELEAKADTATEPARKAAYNALARIVSALLIRHDRVWGSPELIASLATDLACNRAGSEAIGALVAPCIAEAAAREGYKLLPRNDRPVVMNTKGASAAGKSTLRPLQKKLASAIGVDWTDFALISPDIWRKRLLDYGTLGDAYKYAGAFSGDELAIVDEKLDRYMAEKGRRGEMPHLLIDRFRFEAFAPHSEEAGSNLLTRFGHRVYLFFVITPPASLVERAWNRGLEVGRYKAVDDTLAHSVEAYTGMPELFFTWVDRKDKRLVFEFVDNSVEQGERPRTIAFGTNEILNVLDVRRMLDIERFGRVDVDARSPERLFPDARFLAPDVNAGLLRACAGKFREINFADQETGRVYLHLSAGVPEWIDASSLEQAAGDPDVRAGLLAVAPNLFDRAVRAIDAPRFLPAPGADDAVPTLGEWGREPARFLQR